MARDIIYLFDKLTKQGTILGEIQSDFNMSQVIDGTKDSMRVQVWSFIENEIEPYSIIFHKKTMTWWIVSHDKVERYINDSGFYYVHNIDILGAIELLNARDLTDSGFNSNKYTIRSFINRLVKLSNFEFKDNFVLETNANIYLDQVVDFVKTFENYTLLSALREFLDAYNCAAKLDFDFDQSGNTLTLTKAYINIISKTGSQDTPIDINSFDDARETKTLDKNSFGTCVISNAENVISNVAKTFPSVGGVKASGTETIIKAANAVLRLPSKVYKANWLAIIGSVAPIEARGIIGSSEVLDSQRSLSINALSEESFNDAINRLLVEIETKDYNEYHNTPQGEGVFYEPFKEALEDAKQDILNKLRLAATVKLYDGNKLVPYFGPNNDQTGTITIQKGDNVPYLVICDYLSKGDDDEALIFCDKDTKNNLTKTWQGICWERGSNLISGFDGFEPLTGRTATIEINNFQYTELQEDYGPQPLDQYVFFYFENAYGSIKLSTPREEVYAIHFLGKYQGYENFAQFIVNYIPMSDMKIKVDNQRDKNDIQLYNQNGKLTDNYALSKLINSYSKEISSDNITRYMEYYDYTKVPKVGQLVYKDLGNNKYEYYVINNVSINFSQNESNGYAYDYVYHHTLYTLYSVSDHTLNAAGTISGNTLTLTTSHANQDTFNYMCECEITMSKSVAVKSLMVNPNTNIRDYGIPQNFNVKRKQVYRDYYELTYELYDDANEDDPYFPTQDMFSFGETPNIFADLSCVIKVNYNEKINGSNDYYYQLETTNYYLNKMLYVMLDFNDNNIIGYGSQNVWSGFVISRIFSGLTDTLNTPISYVDTNGELESISIYYCTNAQLTTIYAQYQDEQGYGSNTDISLYNYSVFIPKEIYSKASNSHKIEIKEPQYKKDALEVPVFEYACQIEDSDDVLIGDNILFQYDSNHIYFYHVVIGSNFTPNNVHDDKIIRAYTNPISFAIVNGASINRSELPTGGYELTIRLYRVINYNVETNQWSYSTQFNFVNGNDYAIFRHALDLTTNEEKVDLMFIAKKVQTILQTPNFLEIKINHYKL